MEWDDLSLLQPRSTVPGHVNPPEPETWGRGSVLSPTPVLQSPLMPFGRVRGQVCIGVCNNLCFCLRGSSLLGYFLWLTEENNKTKPLMMFYTVPVQRMLENNCLFLVSSPRSIWFPRLWTDTASSGLSHCTTTCTPIRLGRPGWSPHILCCVHRPSPRLNA